MGSLVEDARQAGFSDNEISSWAQSQRDVWKQAGFSDDEIGSYLTGLKQPGQIPQTFLQRMRNAIGAESGARVGGALVEGAQAGFGETPVGLPEEDAAKLQELGIFNKPGAPSGWTSGIRFANEAVIRPAYAATQTMFRGINAALSGIGAAAGQAQAEVIGANESEAARARRDNANLVTIAALLAGAESPVTRAGPAGDEIIGHLPAAQDFTNATKIIADGAVPPLARDKVVRMYEDHGIHPSELASDAQQDPNIKAAILSPNKNELPYKTPANENVAPEGTATSLGAAATENVPLENAPEPSASGKLVDVARESVGKLFDISHDIQKLVSPMAAGTEESAAVAKNFANSLRLNRYEWSRIDDDLVKRFTPEQRQRMWNAADEESVARQLGESTEHQGLTTLEPDERAAVEQLQARAQSAWVKARDLGMVEGEGLPSYTPRMLINVADRTSGEGAIPLNGLGANLRTKTGQMIGRKYMTAEETEAAAKAKLGGEAEIARDIRTLPLATSKLEDAIAGRQLIDSIKEYGKRSGDETVAEGGEPTGSEHKWFTIDHPAFKTWRPKLRPAEDIETAPFSSEGKYIPVKDESGNTIFEQVPIYVRDDFEGPLKAVLSHKEGNLYKAAMSLKAKTMSVIMNSPLIHNAVEWGRALPAMPVKVATFKIYFDGNRAKNDPATMREAITNGLVPIGHRGFKQDITSMMEEPDLTPGRSWTAKLLGAVPGLFSKTAETSVRAAVDKLGDFWHNTLLWDRVGDLQMGLYTNFRDDLMAKGLDRQTAAKAAAHWANRYAGALPVEAMSNGARKFANVVLFSRSFTLGNLGAMKDILTGLPKDVLAQISQEGGDLEKIKSIAQRKALGIVMTDMALLYIGNSILQSTLNVILGDKTIDEETKTYANRLLAKLQEVKEHPLSLLQPMRLAEDLSATSTNEPGKGERVLVGYAKDGTAIYARNPAGKIGEEFAGYLTGPLEMLKKKLGTVARPAWQILSNDRGFGRKVYDETADTPEGYVKNAALIAWQIVRSQFPEGQLTALKDLFTGEGDTKTNALQTFGPVAGITFSRGAPGGPAIGEMYHTQQQHRFAVEQALPDIRKQIQRGDITGAVEKMVQLGISRGLQQFYIRTSINPQSRLSSKTIKDFYLYATEAQRQRFERALGR